MNPEKPKWKNKGALKRKADNKAEWTNDEIEQLIDIVRNKPVLYDLQSIDYRNSGLKELEWIKISSEMQKPGNS